MLTCGSDMTVVSLTQSSCDYAQDETFNTPSQNVEKLQGPAVLVIHIQLMVDGDRHL